MNDPILGLMKTLGLPQTRQQYLELAYLCPYADLLFLSSEEEAELPPQFRKDKEDE